MCGYNLIAPLEDYDKTVRQGLNSAIWAVIAMDSAGYESEIKGRYLEKIISAQNPDGGASDIDITAMALSALAKYRSDEKINSAAERGLLYLSKEQNENGGFVSYGDENPESAAQVVVALCTSIIAVKDDSGRLLNMRSSKKTVAADKSVKINVGTQFSGLPGGGTIEFYLWESLDNMKNIIDKQVFQDNICRKFAVVCNYFTNNCKLCYYNKRADFWRSLIKQ